jgi:hypothetical protein
MRIHGYPKEVDWQTWLLYQFYRQYYRLPWLWKTKA